MYVCVYTNICIRVCVCDMYINVVYACVVCMLKHNFLCFRHLYPRLDALIDERILLGTGQMVQETLGDFAMAMAVELVHNLRNSLDYDQLVKVTYMLCRWDLCALM